jgi:2-phospho-L-lactate transferase/gluconeogenesis factor (CofD/UPF0052 family)
MKGELMNILIIAGGTGSIALQTGLYEMLDKQFDGIDTKILVNAYDNGLSTGSVRKVLGGNILGPSDVRKNQTTRLKLENHNSPWNKFLDIRFTCESSQAQAYCHNQIQALKAELQKLPNNGVADWRDRDVAPWVLVEEAVNQYFKSPIASCIDYNDFSLANIVYAGFAKAHGNSLRAAARVMAGLMNIKDNVILNDDKSLFLGAITKSGIRVTDEGDIVSWGDKNDPFVDLFFTDAQGNETKPVLCHEAREAIANADLIILSSGTQWSSLIPTYESEGFRAMMFKGIAAKILMVMNRQPDKDSPGQTADDIINILVPRYFRGNQIHLIVDETGSEQMIPTKVGALSSLASVNKFKLNHPVENEANRMKHDPHKLAVAVALTYFRDYVESDHLMFDYDDTLVGRGNVQPRASALNKKLLIQLKNVNENVSICTGNSIKAVAMRVEPAIDGLSDSTVGTPYRPLTVFADGGINKYEYDTRICENDDDYQRPTFLTCVHPESIIEKEGEHGVDNVISTLVSFGIPKNKIENRGNIVISIKPIDAEYRPIVLSLVNMLLDRSGLVARSAGRTTIDISKPSVSKADAVRYVMRYDNIKSLTFVGDEFKDGNDAPIADMKDGNVKCLNVRDPAETAFFLKAVLFSKGFDR